MSEKMELCVAEEDAGQRLDYFLANRWRSDFSDSPAISRARFQTAIAAGMVKINGSRCAIAKTKLRAGDAVLCRLAFAESTELGPDADIPLEIVFEDDQLIVLNKQPGLVVHPGAGVQGSTLVHALLAHLGTGFLSVGEPDRPGIVHRLDRDTSGLMLVAKTNEALADLRQQFKPPRRVKREYLAATRRVPMLGSDKLRAASGIERGMVEASLARDPRDRTRFVVDVAGREAVTRWEKVSDLGSLLLLKLQLETGRTHQIRAHLAYAGAPILGDKSYGEPEGGLPPELRSLVSSLGRQALHAFRLGFVHPISGETMQFEVELPGDIQALVDGAAGG